MPDVRRLDPKSMLLSRLSLASCVLGCGALLLLGSSPGLSLSQGFSALICSFLAFAVCGIALVVAALRRRTHLARVRLIAFHVAALLLCAILARTTLLLSARVLASEPWLRPTAQALLRSSRPGLSEPHLIGLFVARASAVNGSVMFDTGLYGFWNTAGIVFAPTDPPPLHTREYSHLYGPWWRYRSHDD